MRFPQTFIDELRRQADIVRVIQDYVSLKKKGTNWMACCPFHQEKTPSFSVNPSKDIFFCFGCQKGGSVFNFVMEMERVSFPEAIRIVAEKANVPLPAMEEDNRFEARRREADEVIQLNAWALEWWEQQLREGAGGDVRAAREYVESRGISEETSRTFRLGFAPDSWDGLSSHLKKRGADAGEIERSGLVVKKDGGGFYDRFRGRVIFPVLDAQGRPVAFGARVLPGGGEPKYLNSPETTAYVKGRHLYGLHQTRDEIRKKKFAILVEGYLDVVIPYQYGVRNAVASLGTALTPEQVKLLGRFARKVVVNYDGDSAGVKAAKRAVEVLLAEDFEVKVLVLPDNADPDEFIKVNGVEEYHKRRGEALPHIQFVLNQAMRDRNLHNPPEKGEAVREALPFVRAVRSRIQKREYFDIVMGALRIEEPALRQELWQTVRAGAPVPDGDVVKQKVARAETPPPTVAELRLLELLVHDAELRRDILPRIEQGDYAGLTTAAIFQALKDIDNEGAEVSFDTLAARTKDDVPAVDIVPLLLMSEPQRVEGEATDEVLADAESCLLTLRLMKIDRRLKELVADISAAERAGDARRRDELVMEKFELERRSRALVAHGGASGDFPSSRR
ncbi:MAG TPA: DNA primase [Pyrinomonadaceae bacterium]|nr:DNA primase [Pyrinomonadaceae bacterium]